MESPQPFVTIAARLLVRSKLIQVTKSRALLFYADYEQKHVCGRVSYSEISVNHDTASSHTAPEASINPIGEKMFELRNSSGGFQGARNAQYGGPASHSHLD